jgi:hypothetical protein
MPEISSSEPARIWLREFIHARSNDLTVAVEGEPLSHITEMLRARFENSASLDLPDLGVTATPSIVESYCERLTESCTSRSLVRFETIEVAKIIVRSAISAPSEMATVLPFTDSEEEPGPNRRLLELTDEQKTDFMLGILKVVGLRLLHERALEAREKYLELEAEQRPRRGIFHRQLSLNTIRWHPVSGQRGQFPREAFVGESAAEASDEMLGILRAQLDFIGNIMSARAGYMRRKGPPKQLGIVKELEHSLRIRLGDSGSELAKSRVVFATLSVFGGDLFTPRSSDFTQEALNRVERERHRLPQELAEESESRFRQSKLIGEWMDHFMRKVGARGLPSISVPIYPDDKH